MDGPTRSFSPKEKLPRARHPSNAPLVNTSPLLISGVDTSVHVLPVIQTPPCLASRLFSIVHTRREVRLIGGWFVAADFLRKQKNQATNAKKAPFRELGRFFLMFIVYCCHDRPAPLFS